MTDVVDFAARRFAAAKDASAVSGRDALVEALRQIDAGEIDPASVVVIALIDHGDDDQVHCVHGGAASSNERIGMLFRAQVMLTPGGSE